MFGYIRPFKPEMKVKEFDSYQAVYCGLCKEMGKNYGVFSRFTLSYDFSFLAVLDMAVKGKVSGFEKQRCACNPLKKKICCTTNVSLEYAAAVAMMMFYHKIRDNIADHGFFKGLAYRLLLPFASRARKKAAKKFPELDAIIQTDLRRQAELEGNLCDSPDRAAEPSAHLLGAVFERMSPEPKQQRVLQRMGYMLGRWVYYLDALDDLQQDYQQKNYNPFLLSFHPQTEDDFLTIRQNAVASLNNTVAEIGSAYLLLEIKPFQAILENVIFLGLKAMQKQILSEKEHKKLWTHTKF